MCDLTPVRQGRLAGQGTWQEQYQALQMTGEEAAALIRNGDVLAVAAMANWPREIDAALARRLQARDEHVAIHGHFVPAFSKLLAPECADRVTYDSNFFGVERTMAAQGNVRFVPTHLSQTADWLVSRHPRVALLTCTPPDENGWMSRSLWSSSLNRKVIERCELVLVEVHEGLPYLESDGAFHTKLHVSEVDGIIPASGPLVEMANPAADDTDRAIAGYIADMVPDGACVQFGLGGLANAIGQCLAYAGKKELGVQTEVMTGCLVDLLEQGVVTNSRKKLYPGRIVGSHLVGNRALWDYAHHNTVFCQKELDFVNDARVICQNDGVVSINNAMEIDLTGQVNAESVGTRQYSGTGGQLEWVVGSQWSKGGKSIIALRSAYRDKNGQLHSKIRPQLSAGSIVTTPRSSVQYVVTEYGVADLKYKNVLERAQALIAIAHPDFRAQLQAQLPW